MTQAARPSVATEPSTPAARPSHEQVEAYKQSFAEDGYLILRNVVPKDGLSQLRSRILDEFDRAKASLLQGGGGLMAGHLNCFPGEGSRFIYEAICDSGAMDVVKAVFPKVLRGPNVGCNLNLPNSVAQHYHADSNYFTEDFVVVNIAVVDTEIANGAIDVLPGTQKKFYPFWRFALERASRGTTRLPMKQGDVLVRTSNLWHRGMPNRTSVPRPMVALTWEDGGSRLDDPFKKDDGKITFHANWYRPDFLGRLRERTYIAAPFTYDAYRFVRSLAGGKGYSR